MIERIYQIISDKGMNVSSFAARCDVKQPTLARQLKGQMKLSLETVEAILTSFPDVDANWLLLGTGEPYKKADENLRKLVSVITTLQDTIENQQATINALKQQIKK